MTAQSRRAKQTGADDRYVERKVQWRKVVGDAVESEAKLRPVGKRWSITQTLVQLLQENTRQVGWKHLKKDHGFISVIGAAEKTTSRGTAGLAGGTVLIQDRLP